MRSERPLPGEHKDIARGSGPAAILLFLHIAVTGYLGYTVYTLVRYNQEIFWNLAPFSAWIFYYLPAAFAVFTYMPTDGLTRIVGRVALTAGALAWAAYAFGWVMIITRQADTAGLAGWQSAAALMAGCAGGLLLRIAFGAGMAGRMQENNKKNAHANEVAE